jgi:hypothetical protein
MVNVAASRVLQAASNAPSSLKQQRLFFSWLIADVRRGSEGKPKVGDAKTLMMQWLPGTDPLGIAEDPECGYGARLRVRDTRRQRWLGCDGTWSWKKDPFAVVNTKAEPRAFGRRQIICITLLVALDWHDADAPAQDRGQFLVAELHDRALVLAAVLDGLHRFAFQAVASGLLFSRRGQG